MSWLKDPPERLDGQYPLSIRDSVATASTENTFFPPYSASEVDSESSIFTPPVAKTEEVREFIEFGPGYEISSSFKKSRKNISTKVFVKNNEKNPRRRRRYVFIIFLLLFILLAAGGGAAFVVLGESDVLTDDSTSAPTLPPQLVPTNSPTKNPTSRPTQRPTSNPTETPTKNPTTSSPTVTPDFCSVAGVSDASMRQLLADRFDDSVQNLAGSDVELNYVDQSIVCIPSDAFSQLSNRQRDELRRNSRRLIFVDVPVQAVHADAFSEDIFDNHFALGFENAQLASLPDGVFARFTGLTGLGLFGNQFQTLNNNILGISQTTLNVALLGNNPLTEFPEFITFAPGLQTLEVPDCPNLGIFNAEAFEGLNEFGTLVIGGSDQLVALSDNEIKNNLGLDSSVEIDRGSSNYGV